METNKIISKTNESTKGIKVMFKNNEKGIALITSLVLSLIAVVLATAIMILVMSSTKQTGTVKRYASALEAAKGGIEEFLTTVKASDWSFTSDTNWVNGHNCKLKRDSSLWSTACSFCNGTVSCSSNSNPNDIINYPDWQKSYGTYTVYAKIIDTKGYVDGYLYNIDVVSTNNNTNEQAWINVLFQVKLN